MKQGVNKGSGVGITETCKNELIATKVIACNY